MNVEIITVGDELLIGQVVDSNSAWMGKALNDIGFNVVRKTAVGDEEEAILQAISAARSRVSVVLMTGGLGPTKDDITMRTLCRYFDCGTRFSDEVYSNIERIFNYNGRTLNELTRNQAIVPDNCTVIQNRVGTAPCTWFERDNFVLVSLPGVPVEMKWLMTNEILTRLQKRFARDIFILHKSYLTTGFTESALAIHLTDFENNLPSEVKLAYLPQQGIIRLRLTAKCKQSSEAEAIIKTQGIKLEQLLDGHIIADEDKNIEVVVGERLRHLGATIATAESCTGGAIAAALTSIAGSSDYFKGGVVSYSNSVKINVLGVNPDDLDKHGAVSREVVEQMAKGALKAIGSDFAIATSGIAGPGGGTAEKPVGTVWIAVAAKDNSVSSKMFTFGTVREQNIQRAVNMGFLFFLDFLQKIKCV
ncbi:MAG: competence/damage-inducible protein A [Tannerella sp.]|jgi:nicotinamide-nucleotide amidase|nr:competence/damage-inducible protein A [Tannerella sp.]